MRPATLMARASALARAAGPRARPAIRFTSIRALSSAAALFSAASLCLASGCGPLRSVSNSTFDTLPGGALRAFRACGHYRFAPS